MILFTKHNHLDIMDNQTLINTGIAIIGGLGGIVIKAIWDAIGELKECHKELQESDRELAEKVHSIETLVAGQYVKRDEFVTTMTTIFTKFDQMNANMSQGFESIRSRMEGKADKSDLVDNFVDRRRL